VGARGDLIWQLTETSRLALPTTRMQFPQWRRRGYKVGIVGINYIVRTNPKFTLDEIVNIIATSNK
jgi:hypothetical protein